MAPSTSSSLQRIKSTNNGEHRSSHETDSSSNSSCETYVDAYGKSPRSVFKDPITGSLACSDFIYYASLYAHASYRKGEGVDEVFVHRKQKQLL